MGESQGNRRLRWTLIGQPDPGLAVSCQMAAAHWLQENLCRTARLRAEPRGRR